MFVEEIKHTNVFFWSDLHYSHNREFIYRPRGFPSVEEHDKVLIERYQTKVPIDATVYLLGDIIFGQNAEARLEELLKLLNGAVINLLPGNHTSGFRALRQKHGRVWNVSDTKTVTFLTNYEEIRVAGQPIVLSHYPILSWNGMGRDSWHLFGHVHGRIPEGSKEGNGFGKMLDVGVEACPEPISFEGLRPVMQGKQKSNIDHH